MPALAQNDYTQRGTHCASPLRIVILKCLLTNAHQWFTNDDKDCDCGSEYHHPGYAITRVNRTVAHDEMYATMYYAIWQYF